MILENFLTRMLCALLKVQTHLFRFFGCVCKSSTQDGNFDVIDLSWGHS